MVRVLKSSRYFFNAEFDDFLPESLCKNIHLYGGLYVQYMYVHTYTHYKPKSTQ